MPENEDKVVKFFAPIIKSGRKVEAVLSDTSIDRDQEVIGKAFLESAARKGALPALMDHENKAMNLIAEWQNIRVEKRFVDGDEHYALVAEPKFFLSNPQAVVVKNMIEKDGAPMGISITAIPSSTDDVEINGQVHKRFVDGEMLSADFVGIPSNRHAAAIAIAKSFSLENTEEVDSMDSKEIVAEINKGFQELREDLVTKSALTDLTKRIEALEKHSAAIQKEGEAEKPEAPKEEPKAEPGPEPEAEKSPKKVELEKKAEKREVELEELRKTPEANTGEGNPTEDADVSVGGLIKAFHPRKEVA